MGAYWERFDDDARRHASRLAVVTPEDRLSYDALRRRALAAAAEILHVSGSARPCRVLISSRDPLAILEGVLGAWAAGAVPAVIHENTPAPLLARLARILRPVFSIHERLPARAAAAAGSWSAGEVSPRAEGLVLTTSGTSGIPKLVALPHKSVLLNVGTISATLSVREDDKFHLALPLSHAYGLISNALVALLVGAEVHLFRPGTPPPVLQSGIRREEATVIQGPPSFFRLFLAFWNGKPFPSVRVFTFGGERYSPELAAGLAGVFPQGQGLTAYGLTEAGPRVSMLALSDPRQLRGGVGTPFPYLEWKLAPVEGEDPRGAGELLLRGPSIMLGYLRPDGGYEGLDENGFLHTRDLVAADAGGCLFLKGRLDSAFKVGGRIVHPQEVEAALLSVPGIAEALCRPEAHAMLGNIVRADVVAAADATVTVAGIRAACAESLEPYKIPARIEFQASLPRTFTGKVSRAFAPASSGSSAS